MNDPLAEILRAWINPGAHPHYHAQMRNRLRQEWPALARALDNAERSYVLEQKEEYPYAYWF